MHPLQPMLCGRCGDHLLMPERDGDIVSWVCRCGWYTQQRLYVARCDALAGIDPPVVDRSGYVWYRTLLLTRGEYILPPSTGELDQQLFLRHLVQHGRHPEFVRVKR